MNCTAISLQKDFSLQARYNFYKNWLFGTGSQLVKIFFFLHTQNVILDIIKVCLWALRRQHIHCIFFLLVESKSSLLCSKETSTVPFISSPHPVLIILFQGAVFYIWSCVFHLNRCISQNQLNQLQGTKLLSITLTYTYLEERKDFHVIYIYIYAWSYYGALHATQHFKQAALQWGLKVRVLMILTALGKEHKLWISLFIIFSATSFFLHPNILFGNLQLLVLPQGQRPTVINFLKVRNQQS
jgi:hypothetical protein